MARLTTWHPLLKVIHWSVAFAFFGLFAVGWWMVELSYYNAWYTTAPDLHKSIGLILLAVMALRLGVRTFTASPTPLPSHTLWERHLAHITHGLLYVGLFVVMISGYLISTADGRAISVFGIVEVPATVQGFPHQADIAGDIHWYGACSVMVLVLLHIVGALKHHFYDKDTTLKRMLGKT